MNTLISLLIAASSFNTATHNSEPTPSHLMDKIERIACSTWTERKENDVYHARLTAFEKSHHVTLPDDVWEVTDQCEHD